MNNTQYINYTLNWGNYMHCTLLTDCMPSEYFELVDYESGSGAFASVFLYPNDDRVDTHWVGHDGPVTKAVIDGLEQLESYGALNWWEVWKLKDSEDYPEVYGDRDTFSDYPDEEDGFPGYLKDNENSYYQYKGLHYGVSSDFDGGGGTKNYHIEDTAFKTNTWMYVGTGSGDIDRVQTFTIQELLHAYVAIKDVAHLDIFKDDSPTSHEHDPGRVYDNGYISPFAITYHNTDDHAGHGTCRETIDSPNGYSQEMTTCSKKAVAETWEQG